VTLSVAQIESRPRNPVRLASKTRLQNQSNLPGSVFGKRDDGEELPDLHKIHVILCSRINFRKQSLDFRFDLMKFVPQRWNNHKA
jgi:hypothetical protein